MEEYINLKEEVVNELNLDINKSIKEYFIIINDVEYIDFIEYINNIYYYKQQFLYNDIAQCIDVKEIYYKL
jgi:hypothetical protein